MTLILNILWFIFGGFICGCLWLLGGFFLAITIIGLPWALAAWRIAGFAFWPFGKEIVARENLRGDDHTGREDIGTGPIGLFLNIIWFIFAGWYIALAHLIAAIAEAITIIGIPFAFKDLQLARLALAPIGKKVVEKR